ncbi:hypothetical protein O5D80_002332 [Batrachochytrium dendrobatidis]|nr:hypothetical protein O5D80_002332 [Batrachochytrium dendrobatidis]
MIVQCMAILIKRRNKLNSKLWLDCVMVIVVFIKELKMLISSRKGQRIFGYSKADRGNHCKVNTQLYMLKNMELGRRWFKAEPSKSENLASWMICRSIGCRLQSSLPRIKNDSDSAGYLNCAIYGYMQA